MKRPFCDNKQCPNHKLELPGDSNWSFEEDVKFVGGFDGMIQSHTVLVTKIVPCDKKWPWSSGYRSIFEEYRLCDICYSAYRKRFTL